MGSHHMNQKSGVIAAILHDKMDKMHSRLNETATRYTPGVVLPVDVAVVETPRNRQRSVTFGQTVQCDGFSQSSRVVLLSCHELRRNCQIKTQLNFAYTPTVVTEHIYGSRISETRRKPNRRLITNKDQPVADNPRDALHHGERAANK